MHLPDPRQVVHVGIGRCPPDSHSDYIAKTLPRNQGRDAAPVTSHPYRGTHQRCRRQDSQLSSIRVPRAAARVRFGVGTPQFHVTCKFLAAVFTAQRLSVTSKLHVVLPLH
jgi:hypothetical protein